MIDAIVGQYFLFGGCHFVSLGQQKREEEGDDRFILYREEERVKSYSGTVINVLCGYNLVDFSLKLIVDQH